MLSRRLLLLSLLLPLAVQGDAILRDASYPEPADPGSAWTSLATGTGTCSLVDTSGDLAITASGPDSDNGCLVYQTVLSGDIQVTGRIASITGTQASTTQAGMMIANSTSTSAAFCQIKWVNAVTQNRGNYSIEDGVSDGGGILGQTGLSLPVYNGINFDDSTNACAMYESDTVSAAPATDYDGVPQPHAALTIDMAPNYVAGFFVHTTHASNTATVNIDNIAIGSSLTLADNAAAPTRTIRAKIDYETGAIQDHSLPHDGAYHAAMRNDPDGLPICESSGGGLEYDFDTDTPNTNCDIQIVKNASPPTTGRGAYGGSTVTPVDGTFMAKHTLYNTKNYGILNGDPAACDGCEKDKPRTKTTGLLAFVDPWRIDYDVDTWFGFSVYIPDNYDYSPTDLQVQLIQLDDQFSIHIKDDCNAGTCASLPNGQAWEARIERSVADGGRISYQIGQDAITADYNKWTSFVVHINLDETGATGFVKVWKSTGSAVSGQCRGFPTNPQVDYTGVLGDENQILVYSRTDMPIRHPRIYKGNWKRVPDGASGPIELYFDAGYVGPDSTTDFEDVNPCMLSPGSAVP